MADDTLVYAIMVGSFAFGGAIGIPFLAKRLRSRRSRSPADHRERTGIDGVGDN